MNKFSTFLTFLVLINTVLYDETASRRSTGGS